MPRVEVRLVESQRERLELYEQRWLVLRAPLGMAKGTERDKYDESAWHFVAVCNSRIVGSLRLRELSPELGSLAYVCVLPEFGGQGIGTKLVKIAIAKASEVCLKRLRVMTRLSAFGFYERLGFSPQGEPFDYLGIPHCFAILNLPSSLDKDVEIRAK